MAPVDLDRLLEGFAPDRRRFLKTLVLGTAYATPLVASFSMDGLALSSAQAQGSHPCVGFNPNLAAADLAITKTASPDPVARGELLTYTLVVINCGPLAAVDVVVEDQLPMGATFVSAEQKSGTPDFDLTTPDVGDEGGLFEATAQSDMPQGAEAVFEIVVRVK